VIGLFVLALIVVGGLTWSGWYFGPRQRLRRLLAAAPRRRIAEAVDGASVRLDGVVQPRGDRDRAAHRSGRASATRP
jgi:hypothetical protein